MDPELKKLIDEQIAAGLTAAENRFNAQLAEVKASVGQTAEAITKIGEIEKNLGIVSQTVAGQKLLTEDGVKTLLAGELQTRAAAAAQKATEDSLKAGLRAKRDAFVAEKLKGVPPKYHTLGDDESKWTEEEKSIREGFAADLQAAGIKVADVGGPAGGESLAPANGGGSFLKMP